MQIYSTRFRVKEALNSQTFVENVIEWDKKRTHPIDIKETVPPFKTGDDDNYTEVITLDSKSIIAARTHHKTDGGIWNTDFILDYGRHILFVYVNRDFSEDTVNVYSKPYMPGFVKQIIKNKLAENSNGFEITDKAIVAENQKVITDSIDSCDDYSLPLVYLSSRSKLSQDTLAAKLTGLAVVVCGDKPVLSANYPEPIYVFFPHKSMSPVYFDDYPQHRYIQQEICNYHNNLECGTLETWNGIKNACITKSNEELLKKYRNTAEENTVLTELYEELEGKMKTDKEGRTDLSNEIAILKAENARLYQNLARLESNGNPIINAGKEKEVYTNEQREIVISVLRDFLKNNDSGAMSRRCDIIKSVIEANPVDDIPERNISILKNVLNGYKQFGDAKMLDAFKKTGIEIIEHNGHYKIALNGDHRYVCTAGATCSDHKAGLNLVSLISKTMF